MLGAETTFLEDFLHEIEAPEDIEQSNMDNVTDLKDWITHINRVSAGGWTDNG